ncbi:MAG: hypothetical protein WCI62_01305, partial [Erysipelotrichaceae bacterium]
AGILIETQSNQSSSTDLIIIGIGLNVYHQDFNLEIAHNAASLEDFTDLDINRNTLIISFFKHFDRLLHSSDYINLYRQWMLPKGTQVQVMNQTESYSALIDSIDEDGRLIVQSNTGLHTLLAEEIKIDLL